MQVTQRKWAGVPTARKLGGRNRQCRALLSSSGCPFCGHQLPVSSVFKCVFLQGASGTSVLDWGYAIGLLSVLEYSFIQLFIWVYVCTHAHTMTVIMGVRGQFSGVSSVLPQCENWELNSISRLSGKCLYCLSHLPVPSPLLDSDLVN